MHEQLVIWFTGMSGAGKSTLADALSIILKEKGLNVIQLDGDAVRKIDATTEKFTEQSILANNYAIIDECVKKSGSYDAVIVSVISPYARTRAAARDKLKKKYFEVFVKCSKEQLIRRDTKGLYKKAINKEIDNLIGFSSKLHYEEPANSDLIISTDKISKQEAVRKILSCLPFE